LFRSNPTNASRSNSDTHSGPNIPDFPNQFITQNTVQPKAQKPKTSRYRDDSEEEGITEVKKPDGKKSRRSGKSAVTTVALSDPMQEVELLVVLLLPNR
jgi:hypothetical protein